MLGGGGKLPWVHVWSCENCLESRLGEQSGIRCYVKSRAVLQEFRFYFFLIFDFFVDVLLFLVCFSQVIGFVLFIF